MARLLQVCTLCVLFCLPALIAGVPVSSLNEEEHVDIQRIDEISELRSKRSASDSNLPDHLSFNVPVAGENVVLRLKRSKLLPTFSSQGKMENVADDAAVYTDLSRESAMIVKRSTGNFKLSGTFSHANQAWNLEPSSRQARSTSSHRVFPQRAKPSEVISFVGDTFYETERHEITTKHTNRSKRAITEHVVELAFVVDYEDYTAWIGLVGASNALSEMRLWYTYVSESVNIRYASIQDPSIAITTKTTFLRILTNPTAATFISSLVTNDQFSGSAGLAAFRNWIISEGAAIPTSDHYMLFTGFDIIGATGIAISSRVCTSSSVSISENTFQGNLGGIAAHELGHSLSADHDSDVGCNDTDDFVMAAILGTPVDAANAGNPWRFSSCSIANFTSYLSGVACTLPENTSTDEELPAPVSGQRAGEILSRDQQCVRAFQDDSSFFCTAVQQQQGGIDQLCGGMYCFIPDGNDFCQTTLPQEYTLCGTDKWCVQGVCIDIQEDTTTPTTPSTTTPSPTTPSTTTPSPTTPSTTTPSPTTSSTTTPSPTTPSTTTPSPTTSSTTTPSPTTSSTTTPSPTTPSTTTPSPTTPSTTTPSPTTSSTTTPSPTTSSTTTPIISSPTAPTTTPTSTPVPTVTTSTTTPQPTTTTATTTQVPTTPPTTVSTSTTTRRPGPTQISQCIFYLQRRDWRSFWVCVRIVIFNQNQQREQERRDRQREREQERKDRDRPQRPSHPRGWSF